MAEIPNHSQNDPQWSKKALGFSTLTTIGSDGCTITGLGMFAGLTPPDVNDRLVLHKGYALVTPEGSKIAVPGANLIVWGSIKKAIPWVEHEWRGYSFDEAKVKDAINKYGACLVEVKLNGGKHWVLYIPGDLMKDPLDGKTKSIGVYPNRTGYSIIKKVGNSPQESVDSLYWLHTMYQEKGIDIKRPEDEIRWKVQDIFDNASKYEEATNKLQKCERDLAEANGTSAKWEENYSTSMKQNDELKEEITFLKKTNANLESEIDKMKVRIDSLEKQIDPDLVIVLKKEEYIRLTSAREITKFSFGELLAELLVRLKLRTRGVNIDENSI